MKISLGILACLLASQIMPQETHRQPAQKKSTAKINVKVLLPGMPAPTTITAIALRTDGCFYDPLGRKFDDDTLKKWLKDSREIRVMVVQESEMTVLTLSTAISQLAVFASEARVDQITIYVEMGFGKKFDDYKDNGGENGGKK